MLGMLVLALHDLRLLLRTADIAAAMSVEGQLGTDRVFAAELQALRPHPGQAASARQPRALLADSGVVASHRGPDCNRVQDAYSLRCSPQVHGAARDTVEHAAAVADRELASAVDNPVVVPDGRVESNGNFHGAPVAYVLDFLAIVAADVASISERRTDRFLDKARNHGLPPFLADDPGVDSGHMIAQYTQAAIVSELKRLAVPASVDSIPSSAMQEDHVSMGWSAARKLRRSVDGLTRVVAIEVLTAARALDLRAPLEPSPATGAVVAPAARERRRGPRPRPPPLARDRGRRRRSSRSGAVLAAVEDSDRRARMTAATNPRLPIHAARGTELTARSWQTEAPLRMLMNNLDPENAERPEDLVVYGGTGKAARNWASYDALVRTLSDARATTRRMLVQSGKPVGVMRTHEWAPRVLIANSNLVGDWANWEEFRRLEDLGLTMYGQMTAGSWIYIGTQGILQGTFETFAAVADKRFGGTLAGTITVTAGLGGMGGAQPLAVTMNDGVAICIECDQSRIERRIEHRYLDVAGRLARRTPSSWPSPRATSARRCRSACSATPPTLLPRAAGARTRRSTSSPTRPPRTTRCSTCRSARPFEDWERAARRGPGRLHQAGAGVDGRPRAGDGRARRTAAPRSSTTATRSATRPARAATTGPSSSPASCRRTSGRCSARARARSAGPRCRGDPADIAATDRAILELFPDNERLQQVDHHGRRAGAVPGPAGAHLLARVRRAPPRRPEVQRDGRRGRAEGADRDRPRPPRLRLGRLALPRDRGDARRLRRDRRLGAAQRAGQHRLRARPGSRSTTAAASASAARSTPARSASPTAPTWPRRRSSGCSPTTRAWA